MKDTKCSDKFDSVESYWKTTWEYALKKEIIPTFLYALRKPFLRSDSYKWLIETLVHMSQVADRQVLEGLNEIMSESQDRLNIKKEVQNDS